MSRKIVYGVIGGLLGGFGYAFVDKVVTTYKEVKASMNSDFIEDLNVMGDIPASEPVDVYSTELYEADDVEVEKSEAEQDLTFDDVDVAVDLISDHIEGVYPEWVLHGGHNLISDYKLALDIYMLYGREKEDLVDMKYGANTPEAMAQYKAMKLADVQMSSWWNIIYRLFEVRFNPINEMDDNIKTSILSDREEFFGENSIYSNEVSIGELILHFADLMSLDFGESTDYFAEWLVSNLCIGLDDPESDYVELGYKIENHDLYTKKGFGMFGLTVVQMHERTKDTLFEEYNRCSFFEEFEGEA